MRKLCDCGSQTQEGSDFCWDCEHAIHEILYSCFDYETPHAAEHRRIIDINIELQSFFSLLETY